MSFKFNLSVLIAFLTGALSTSLFCLNSDNKHYDLVSAETYFDGVCKLDTCRDQFKSLSDKNAIDTKFVRISKLANMECHSSNEDSESVIQCFNNGQLLLIYDRSENNIGIVYSDNKVLLLADKNRDGRLDNLSYEGIDDSGAVVRLVEDRNMDGIFESIIENNGETWEQIVNDD